MKRTIALGLMLAFSLRAAPTFASSVSDKAAVVAGLGLLGAALSAAAKSRRTEMIAKRGSTTLPQMETTSKARPGEAVYAEFNYDAVPVLRVVEAFFHAKTDQYPMQAGTLLYKMVNGRFCRPGGDACVEDIDGDGVLDKPRWLIAEPGSGDLTRKVKSEVRCEKDTVLFDASDNGFRSELVYQGVANGVARLAYREFVNDMARPAFTQEITYDLKPEGPTLVAFQGLLIEIAEASNLAIEYKITQASR